MNQTRPKRYKVLNQPQLLVLNLLYRFRFMTAAQLAKAFHKNRASDLQKRLKILAEQDYINKRYDKTYRLQGKPAAYYLTPKGFRYLQRINPYLKKWKLKDSLYRNKHLSEAFIIHQIKIADLASYFNNLYGQKLELVTVNELVFYSNIPHWLPDLLLIIKFREAKGYFFLDLFEDSKPFFVYVRKARSYLNYAQEIEEKYTGKTNIPIILMICVNPRRERKLRRQILKAQDELFGTVVFATTTLERFLSSTKGYSRI